MRHTFGIFHQSIALDTPIELTKLTASPFMVMSNTNKLACWPDVIPTLSHISVAQLSQSEVLATFRHEIDVNRHEWGGTGHFRP